MRFLFFLALCLLAGLALAKEPRAPSAQARWVGSPEQFVLAMKLHREKVKLLAMDVYRRFPERFASISASQVVHYIEQIHDLHKLDAPISARMVEYWGKRISQLPEPQRSKGLALISELNRAEAVDASRFFERYAWSAEAKRSAKALETIADLLDRGLAPLSTEEFGQAHMALGGQYLKNAHLEQFQDVLSVYEQNGGQLYQVVTRGYQYEEVVVQDAVKRGTIGTMGIQVRRTCLRMSLQRMVASPSLQAI